jgi:hypothetical protein
MGIPQNSAAIDTDFLNHVVSMKCLQSDISAILIKMFSTHSIECIMHPLVYKHEVQSSKPLFLFTSKIIQVPSLSDIFEDETQKQYYCEILVPELYKQLTGEVYPIDASNILNQWKSGKSFGEVHTVSMCLLCGCALFLSDDHGSKQLQQIIETTSMGSVKVYNRSEFLDFCSENDSSLLPRATRRAFTHKP